MKKRQLKKISKKVAEALGVLGCVGLHFNGREYGICRQFIGNKYEFYREFIGRDGGRLEGVEEAIPVLWDWFWDSITFQNPDEEDDEFPEIIICPKGFNSLSEINQIHFMINLLVDGVAK